MMKAKWVAVLIWMSLCMYTLVVFLTNSDDISSELEIAYYIKMLILNFPSGYIVALTTEIFLDLFDPEPMVRTTIVWFSMVAIGYIQWFVFIPALFNRIKNPQGTKS